MLQSNRVKAALGLGLAGVLGLVGQSMGQAPGDRAVQKTNGNQTVAAAGSKPALIGSIDMEKVIQGYEKYSESSELFKAEALKKQQELTSLLTEAKQYAEKRDQMKVGTPDYQKWNDKHAEVMGKYAAEKEKVSLDFTLRESKKVAEIYNDIRRMTEGVAKKKGLSFVVQVSKNEPVTGDDPNTVMAAIGRNIVFYDASTDISNEVLQYLNYYHKQAKDAAGTAAPTTGAAPATAPAGAAPAPAAPTAAAPAPTRR